MRERCPNCGSKQLTVAQGEIYCNSCYHIVGGFTEPDLVNHPPHYTFYNGIEVIQLTEQMNFNRGNAVKYICRAGLKDDSPEIQDLEKARWYIDREIERLKREIDE